MGILLSDMYKTKNVALAKRGIIKHIIIFVHGLGSKNYTMFQLYILPIYVLENILTGGVCLEEKM